MMDLILDNIFLIVLLFVGAISQWLKARSEAKQQPGPEYDPREIEEMLEEAERRHSRPAVPPPLPPAAFPSPASAAPAPAPVLRKQRQTAPSTPPPLSGVSAELERQRLLAEKVKELKLAKKAAKTEASKKTAAAKSAGPVAAAGLKSRLHSRSELRQAFVLREILDKPVGLK